MNIRQAQTLATLQLATCSPSASLDAQVLLSHVLQASSAHLLAWPEKLLTAAQLETYHQLLLQRQQGIPVAHLTGQREFWSLNFAINNSTLIPRPETETLVEFILDRFAGRDRLKLLELGTGSGAIAIALATEKPQWQIIASDIARPALELAQYNRQQLKAHNISFVHSDWFANISDKDFDLIVSNPPYIASDDPHLSHGDVIFEPASALVAGSSGMDAIEHICSQAKEYLTENGWLIVEHGYNQKQQVAECFAKNAFTEISQQQDLSGQDRMTAARR